MHFLQLLTYVFLSPPPDALVPRQNVSRVLGGPADFLPGNDFVMGVVLCGAFRHPTPDICARQRREWTDELARAKNLARP